jgi:DNA-binding transcriptional ArsR family regulator
MPAPQELESPAGTDAVLRALGDPHRRDIIRLIRDSELPAGQIAANFTLTQQAVSQHLAVLKKAGLLEERREGARRLYRFHSDALVPVRDLLDEFWPDALERLKRVVERDHPKKKASRS